MTRKSPVDRAFSYLRLNNARIFCQNVSSGAFTGLVLGAGFLTADLAAGAATGVAAGLVCGFAGAPFPWFHAAGVFRGTGLTAVGVGGLWAADKGSTMSGGGLESGPRRNEGSSRGSASGVLVRFGIAGTSCSLDVEFSSN